MLCSIRKQTRRCVFNAGDSEYEIMVEPGRSIVATTGTLLCSVLGTKVGKHINTPGECGKGKMHVSI